ncbi:MAG: sigma-70 family RNA polymerase sigma factor [Planctomycetaceae bacterium]|nr:MAG: sigma-70 family RNA polymerase sigma factor [Planctomycetaceae bacterium]
MTASLPEDPDASDLTLLARLRAGEPDAATELYLRYARRLHSLAQKQISTSLARRIDPEEIVQSVFRTFFRRAKIQDYVVPEGEELWRLLLVITLNKIRRNAKLHNAQRRDVRRTAGGSEGIDQYLADDSSADETALAILRMVVDDVIHALPANQQEIVRLRIEGYEIDEISRKTERAKRTVERTLQEFRAELSKLLSDSQAGAEVPEREE